jgi:hypothetical protein
MSESTVTFQSPILVKLALLALATMSCFQCKNTDDEQTNPVATGGTGGTGGTTNVLPSITEEACKVASDVTDICATEYLTYIGCNNDYVTLASKPLTSSIPGAISAKVVMDQANGNALYFQNSKRYPIHYDFASTHLGFNQGYADVGTLVEFNRTEYSSPDRRFVLGAITYYEGPKIWTLELSPYDKASAAMTANLYNAVKKNAYFGPALNFHPTSDVIATMAKDLPANIFQITTDQLFAGIEYQPLNVGETIGQVHFIAKDKLATDYVGFRDIAILEAIPNDIAVTAGIITDEFQTPLSHVNVLARNRGTPNMGLRGAFTNAKFKALDGKWVRFTVGSEDWKLVEVSQAEADTWWEANKPAPIELPGFDLTKTDFLDIKNVTVENTSESLFESITTATYAFGAKAANYSILANTQGVPIRPAFAIPIFYYNQFMEENGFYDRVRALQATAEFKNDLAVRDAKLAELRKAIIAAPLNPDFMAKLQAKLAADYPGISMRFRTSTNAEDLNGFPCAGCYDSHTGDPNKGWDDVWDAIKTTWSGVWFYRTYQEREYHSIDHTKVGMALLVHHNFPNEEANGVAVTGNIYEPKGLDPAYYVNVQWGGDVEVVAPKTGVTSDEFLYYYSQSGQPTAYLSHSSLLPSGTSSVLTRRQVYDLGNALTAIHDKFSNAFGPGAGNNGWYAMDVEFKFDDEDSPGAPALVIKQARPYPDPADDSDVEATVCQ